MFGYRTILVEPARPAVIRDNPRAPWLAVGVVCFGAFMGQLDASIVTLTFRPMERAFAAPLAAVQWVSLLYLLGLIGLLVPAGRIGDAAGRKLVYSWGFVVFTIASAACGLAPSLGALIGVRLVQAAGAAMLQANSVALVTTSAPRRRLRFALGVQAGAQSLGLALGPTLGGLLTATVGWRFVYWVNVPVGIIAVIAARYLLPRTRQFSPAGRFDWQGTVLLAGATSALLLALSAASGLGLPGWSVAALCALAVAAGAAFCGWELRASSPLIPVSMLRSANLMLALGGAMCGYLTLFGPLVLIPQVLANGSAEASTGLLLSALPAGFGVAALCGDAIVPSAWSDRQRGAAGALVACAAMCVAITAPLSAASIVPLLAVTGLGLGVFVPANNTVIMRSSEQRSASLLGGMVNMARGIGTTLGISLMALALHVGASRAGPASTAAHPSATLAFILLAIVAAVAVVIALAGRGGAAAPDSTSGTGADAFS
jgi:MFS family permease